ncbi:MAG TPA: hypothetical protein ENK57_06755 [Polyangiaceae bacterium]|nr:hypothetical protein [Polyangiaceae bacterium]
MTRDLLLTFAARSLLSAVGTAESLVWAPFRALFASELEAAGDLHTRQESLSQLITLAVLADGEVSAAEAENLRHLFTTSDRFTGDPDAEIERLRECARLASKRETLDSTIRVVSSDLDQAWREEAFRFVAILALRGSGYGTAQQGFRQAPMSDPGELLEIFSRALLIPPDVRDAAIRQAEPPAGAESPNGTGSGA